MTKFYGFYRQTPTVTGFLGGITFGAMILFLDSSAQFKYSELLTPVAAMASIFFIFATLGSIKSSDEGKIHEYFFELIGFFTLAGLIAIMVIIPLVVYAINPMASYAIIIIESACLVCFFFFARLNR